MAMATDPKAGLELNAFYSNPGHRNLGTGTTIKGTASRSLRRQLT
jgi:hypothetical protein